jgi:flagellar basal-body rod protein FlgB
MIGGLKLLSMASALARHAAARHGVISENIANANVAGFKARDIEPFADAYRRATQSASAADIAKGPFWRSHSIAGTGLESPNGNTVSLEDQLMRSIEAQQNHEAATAIYRKSLDILRTSLGRGV